MTVQTNVDQLVAVSVMGHVAEPGFPGLPASPYLLTSEGKAFLLPMFGGIVYNVSVGDSAYGWLADTIHPSVSINLNDDRGNRGLNIYACVGNDATIMTGDAKGEKGMVTGKSGRFSEHVIVHFPKQVREKMAIGDKVVVKAHGVGMALPDYPDVRFKSCAPSLFDKLGAVAGDNGQLCVPVTAIVPPHLLGAGAGLTSEGGSIHIQTTDKGALAEYGLDKLRLGDVVALQDYDSRWNHGYLRGAVGIGVIGQGDSPRNGYGPGISMLMTAAVNAIEPTTTGNVNIKELLGLPD